jgi:glycosyltransferase involved in cell wall biosynthesis
MERSTRGCGDSERPTEDIRKLRILQVVPTYFPAVRYGGPIRSVHFLASALVQRGHEVHVFTTSVDGPHDLDVPISMPVNMDGVLVHYFPVRWLRRLYWSGPMRAALMRDVGAFDVMHLHSVFLRPTWAAARAAHAASVPYVISPRGSLGREVIRRKSRWIKSAWIRLIEQKNLSEAAGLHVTSELERREIEALGLRLPRIFCVPNGVGWPDKRTPLSAGPFANIAKPYALFLGRITAKKGLDRLLAAWQWVPDLVLIIAGNDESGYQRKLEIFLHHHQISERVRFIGSVTDDQKWSLYENATMFILPSYSENFGNVVAEAMAMGCPVIVTPEVGMASLVVESGAGVVADGAPITLAATIRALLADSVNRRLMGERGQLTVLERLSWPSVARSMESMYIELSHGGDVTRRSSVREHSC